MSLYDEIKALPEWPKWCGDTVKTTFPSDFAEWDTTCHALIAYAAALARLALAREWINDAHTIDCDVSTGKYPQYESCTCGRDELLAALEPPK